MEQHPEHPTRISLPAELTSFIGRARERRELAALLLGARLVTVTGAGGCGKTRLALRVAAEAASRFPAGVFWVSLARLADPALLPQTVAEALGVRLAAGGQPAGAALAAELRDRQALLVLDNCEHLAAACAELAAWLLGAPGAHLLATSREPLAAAGEQLYPLAPLPVPPPNLPANQLAEFESVQLFAARARARLPGFSLTAANVAGVAGICRQLDGLPLAIELASARANVMSVEQMAARLAARDRLAWLVAPERAPVAQHATLRSALDWSYALLTPAEQRALRWLSVFAGGATLDSAEAVCREAAGPADQPPVVLERLTSLVNKSLVVAEALQHSEARYTLLETIRVYAREKLAEAGEEPAARERHLQRFIAVAEEAAAKLRGPYQQLWLNWLEAEHDNLRAALGWALEGQNAEAGLRLATALLGFWEMRGHVAEGAGWYERLLALPRAGLPVTLAVTSVTYATFLAMLLGDSERALLLGREAVALAEAGGAAGQPLLGQALAALGSAAVAAGDHQTQFALTERAIPFFRAQNDAGGLGMTLLARGAAGQALGHYAEARAALDESLTLFRGLSDPFRTAIVLNSLGDLARLEQDLPRARSTYEASVALLRSINAERELGSGLRNLALTCLRQDEIGAALDLLREALPLQQAQANTHGVAESLTGFAAVALARQQPAAAARLLGAAVGLAGAAALLRWPVGRLEFDWVEREARAGLAPEAFEREQAAGRLLALEAAVTYALSLPLGAPAAPARPGPDGLTPREREVAALIGQGHSNAEIAATLVLSKRTVEKHIANLLGKLGLASRAQIVRWAIARGLAVPER